MNEPPIDLNALFEQCMNDVNIVTLVLDKLSAQLTNDLLFLDTAKGSFDPATVLRTAHALKGAAGASGAGPLESAARLVEEHAGAGTLDSSSAELDALRDELIRCAQYVQTARSLAEERR